MYTPVSLCNVSGIHTIKKWLIEGHYLYSQGFYFWYFNRLRSTPFFWCVFHFLCGSLQSRTSNEARREEGGREVACVADILNHLGTQMVETMHGPAATQASGRGSARKKEDCSLCPLLSRPLKKRKKRKKTLAMLIFKSGVGCPHNKHYFFASFSARSARGELDTRETRETALVAKTSGNSQRIAKQQTWVRYVIHNKHGRRSYDIVSSSNTGSSLSRLRRV